MQVLQAGIHKLILLELEADLVNTVAKQAGFESRVKDSPRSIQLELTAAGRQGPLLLFDAADPANLGWFSRCQFYIDGRTGGVMQTPIAIANKRCDRQGKSQANSVRLRISEGAASDAFRLSRSKQPITEQKCSATRCSRTFSTALTKNRSCGLRRRTWRFSRLPDEP